MQFDNRETATLLAALRCWQQQSENSQFALTADFDALMQVATCDGAFEALENDEIDALCERINATVPSESAAPDLLRKLTECVKMLETIGGYDKKYYAPMLIHDSKEVIAKARGELKEVNHA